MGGEPWQRLRDGLRPRARELRRWTWQLRRSPLTLAGLIIVLSIVMVAVLAPVLAPPLPERLQPDPLVNRMDLQAPKPPGTNYTFQYLDADGQLRLVTVGYPLGTGQSGEDIYYGVVWGARTSLTIALVVVFLAALIGTVLGALSGYFGGAVDEVLMRITDVFLSIPAIILALAIVAVLSRSLDNILLALTIAWWPAYARLVRGQVLVIRERAYVESARAAGAGSGRIIFRHILPNAFAPVLVSASLDMGTVVLAAAGLSFIGFSQPGLCEWGRMVSAGSQNLFSLVQYGGEWLNPYWSWVYPGALIFLFVLGFSLLGDGLRDMMDPRGRR